MHYLIVDQVHSFETLRALELSVKNRWMTERLHILQYSELAAELTGAVSGCMAFEVLPMVEELDDKVHELIAGIQDKAQREGGKVPTDKSETSDTCDTTTEWLESNDGSGEEISELGELQFSIIPLIMALITLVRIRGFCG